MNDVCIYDYIARLVITSGRSSDMTSRALAGIDDLLDFLASLSTIHECGSKEMSLSLRNNPKSPADSNLIILSAKLQKFVFIYNYA